VPEKLPENVENSNRARIESIVRHAVMEWSEGGAAQLGSAESDSSGDAREIFDSPTAIAIKKEIVRAGKKLWHRQYVDGNGGNISFRISDRYVICTPTLVSKGDLRQKELVLVDMENHRICGDSRQSSEIQLHLEIYKTVPQAKAVIHCHPPYATAYAVAGIVPRENLLPEQAVFVGTLALAPYATPGTVELARSIHSVAKRHNAILLANHGLVCWADTVTHAEWYVEVVDTYCKTILIASQLRSDLQEIPKESLTELFAIRRRLGISLPVWPLEPDDAGEQNREENQNGAPVNAAPAAYLPSQGRSANLHRLVDVLTDRISAMLDR